MLMEKGLGQNGTRGKEVVIALGGPGERRVGRGGFAKLKREGPRASC